MHRSIFDKIWQYLRIRHIKYSNALNILLVIYAALLPISGAFSTHTGPYLLLILWLLEGDLPSKIQRIKSEKTFILLIVLFLFYLLSLTWTEEISRGLHSLKYYFSIVIVASVYFTSTQKKFMMYIMGAFLFSMFVSEIISYGIFLEWWQIGSRGTPENPTPFMHHIKYSIFLGTTIFLLLWQILGTNIPKTMKVVESLFLISATTNIFINGGRTGQLGLIFGFIVFSYIYFEAKIKYLIGTIFLLCILFTGAYQFSPIFQNRVQAGISDIKKMSHGNLGSSWGLRVAMKLNSIPILKEHPLIGVGVGDVWKEFYDQLEKSELKKYSYLHKIPHVHDQFLQTTLQTGIIGLGILLMFLYSLFKKDHYDILLKSILSAIFTIIIFSFFTEVSLRNNTSALLAFIVGFFWNYSSSKSGKNHVSLGEKGV